MGCIFSLVERRLSTDGRAALAFGSGLNRLKVEPEADFGGGDGEAGPAGLDCFAGEAVAFLGVGGKTR